MDSYPQRFVTVKLGTVVPFLSMVLNRDWSWVFPSQGYYPHCDGTYVPSYLVIYPGRGGVRYS